MSKNWKDITDDEILNIEVGSDELNARYNRIMQKKSIDSIIALQDKLTGLMETIYRASQDLKEKTEEVIGMYDKIHNSQSRHQFVIIVLSIIIALSTIAYTCITWQTVSAMREANSIQRKLLDVELNNKIKGTTDIRAKIHAKKNNLLK